MNEEKSGRGPARIEFVPFPGDDDALTGPGDRDPEFDDGQDPDVANQPVHRSKEATGWAASGLAGALRRSRRLADT